MAIYGKFYNYYEWAHAYNEQEWPLMLALFKLAAHNDNNPERRYQGTVMKEQLLEWAEQAQIHRNFMLANAELLSLPDITPNQLKKIANNMRHMAGLMDCKRHQTAVLYGNESLEKKASAALK